MNYSISEIFKSIQGEGGFAGTPMLFVRFAGCNLNCSWCDTDHHERIRFDEETLIGIIKRKAPPNKIVCFTGGEPMLQLQNSDLPERLLKEGYASNLETNGTIEVGRYFNWITVSPKNKEAIQREGGELKIVYTGQSKEELAYYRDYENFNFIEYYLQPCDPYITVPVLSPLHQKRLNEMLEIVEEQDWTLSLQTQKLLRIQ